MLSQEHEARAASFISALREAIESGDRVLDITEDKVEEEDSDE